MEDNKALKRFGELVGYTEPDLKHFQADDPRVRQMERLGRAAARYPSPPKWSRPATAIPAISRR